MKKIKSTMLAISLICAFSLALAGCNDNDSKKSGTSVVTKEPGNSNSSSDKDTTEVTIPEKDDDGSKITVFDVTDTEGNTVTDSKGAPVTTLALVDDDGKAITDAKGNYVAPNIAVTKKPERVVSATGNSNSNGNGNGNSNSNVKVTSDGPTVSIDKDIEASAGEEFKFKINITGNTGYTSLIAWLDIDTKYFEFVSFEGGDPDSSNYKRSPEKLNTLCNEYTKPGSKDLNTLVLMYFDPSCVSLVGDTTYATITLKVKEDTPKGTYDLAFDAETDGTAKCNNVDADKNVIVCTPKYQNGSIKVK